MTTVADVLERQSQTHPDDHAFVFLDEDETTVSYRELDTAARRVAAAISAAGGSERPVLLLYPPGRAYVEGFLGCLYAGAVPVPAYPPDAHRLEHSLARLRNLVADCGARLALTVAGIVEAVPALVARAPELAAVEWIATDTVPAADWTLPRLDPDRPALLQYTSGSTGTPKGVVLTHANLIHNAGLVQHGFGTSDDAVGVSWLPPYHDMGLIGGVLQPLFARFTTVLMSPLTFLQRPMVWLEAISRYGATMSGGPNFGYDLCVRKSTADERAALDLSRWQLAFTGAEPVRPQTLDRFAEAFEPAGFRRHAFYPCYGLAEATLIVTGGRPRQVGEHVGSGRALGDQRVAIVTDDTEQPAGTEGEIWVSGPSVARGYHRRPVETEQAFGARLAGEPDRTWLRTGDLGFLDPSGELVVTGRAKDLIIIRGRNVYPQDLEQLVEQVDGVRPGCSAAFGTESGGEERVAVVCEVAGTDGVVAGIRQALAESAELVPASIVLLEPRRIPKTSSGKIQRHACRTAFDEGALDGVLERWDQGEVSAGGDGVAGLVAETLGLAEVAGDEALTRYGLDSLHAVELRAALEARFGVQVALSELLSGVTVDELANRSAAMDESPPADQGLSPGVRALWFLQRWVPDSTAYHINRAARIRSALDVDALRRAFDALVERHPALRLRLPSPGGEPVAEYADPAAGVLSCHHVSGLDDAAVQELVRRDSERPFDLATGPLFRAGLYSRGPEDHVLLLSLHHVITDFWSLSIMVDDLLALYVGKTLPELPQHLRRAGGSDLEYWRAALDDTPAALELPLAFPRPKVQSFRGASHVFRTGAETLHRLDSFAEQAGVTRFVVVLGAYAALLARYAGEDVVIGTPTAGREDAASTRTVGYFVNPVPLRVRVEPGITFRALVGQVRDTVLGALDHAVPFPQLVEALRPVRDPGRAPIMQTMLAMQQAPPGRADLAAFAVDDPAARIRLGDLDVQPYRLGDRGSAFDLSVHLGEVDGALSGVIEYCADLFDPATIAGLGRQFESLLAAVVADPDTGVAKHGLIDAGERAALLALADGGPPLESASTLPALFARQTRRRAGATAVVFGTESLSYAELDDRSNRLAAVLRDRFGVRRGDRVGVHLPRGLDATVAFWAVLKSGGCYLPLEPTLPPARVALLLADGKPAAVLTHRAMADRLPEVEHCYVDAVHWTQTGSGTLRSADHSPSSRLPFASDERHEGVPVEAGDLAYLLYTSGSTGRPKGVLVEHRGAANMSAAFSQGLGVTEDDRILQYSSCGFDISVMETLMAHLNGAALHLVPQSAVVPGPELASLLADQRITAAVLTPSTVAALPATELPDLTRLILGAEALAPDLVARWGRGRQVFNAYGPTEITVAATWTPCDPEDPRPPAIGRPIPGARSYVLDDRLEPVPVGVPGELYIGGVGVARGYLDQPELTGQRFVPDPNRAGERMYRTGDRVRWRPDGMLDFLGRLDDQVKVRGNRVEPAEVETRLRELLGLATVAVLPRQGPGGATELVAYLVSDRERMPAGRLRGMLRAELPEPYVPAAFVYLAALPTTLSGKIDRRALPDPTPTDRGTATRRPPRTRTEQIVADVWADVLEQPSIGMDDHFFDQLGGHSLLVAKVASRLSDRIGRDVPVTHLFEHPTAAALARRLDGQQSEPADQVTSQAMAQAAARRQALTRRRRSG